MSISLGRIALGVATGGLSEAGKYAYDQLYKGPADEQKRAATHAADDVRRLGNEQRDLYEDNRKRSQGYYDNASNSPDYLRDYYNNTKNTPGTQHAQGQYYDDKNYYTGHTTNLAARGQANENFYNSPSEGAAARPLMDAYGNASTRTTDRYDLMRGTDMPDYLQDRYKDQRQAGPVDLSQNNQRIDSTGRSITGMEDSAGSLRFDPTQTQAIGSLYNNYLLPDEKKNGYLEDFYEQTANGTNPYYDRLREQTAKSAQRRAAASGNFNAGASQRQESEALTDLSAKEFSERAQMAGAAQTAHQGRLNDLTGQAKTYEDTVLGNRRFNLDVASETNKFALGKGGLSRDLAIAGDKNYLEGKDIAGRDATRLDNLAKGAGDEYMGHEGMLNDLARGADDTTRDKNKSYTDYLKDLEAQAMDRRAGGNKSALDIDTQDMERRRDLDLAADRASDEAQRNIDNTRGAAKDASDEGQKEYDNRLKLAAAKVGIDLSAVTAEGKALSDAELAAIKLELQRAGIDAATIGAMIDDVTKAGKVVADAAK